MLRYMLLPLLALTAGAYVLERAPCKGAGFFAPIDKTPAYYGCYPNKDGGFTMKILTCPAGQVFSLEVRHCMPAFRVRAALHDEEIENPTKPPSSSKQPDIESPTGPTHSTAKPDGSTENMAETTEEKEPSTEPTSEPTESTQSSTTTEKTPSTAPSSEPSEPSEPTVTPSEPTPSKEPTESTESSVTTEKAPTTAPSSEPSEPSEPTVTSSEPTPAPSEPTISPEPIETTSEVPETPTEKPFTCPTKGFFPSREGCNKFVYCMSSSPKSDPIELSCPPGQEFNPSILFCDETFKCDAESESESKVAAALFEFDCIMEGVFPDAEDKTKYFFCKWSENAQSFQYEHKSCGKSEVFHRLTGKCGRHLQLPKTLLNLGH